MGSCARVKLRSEAPSFESLQRRSLRISEGFPPPATPGWVRDRSDVCRASCKVTVMKGRSFLMYSRISFKFQFNRRSRRRRLSFRHDVSFNLVEGPETGRR